MTLLGTTTSRFGKPVLAIVLLVLLLMISGGTQTGADTGVIEYEDGRELRSGGLLGAWGEDGIWTTRWGSYSELQKGDFDWSGDEEIRIKYASRWSGGRVKGYIDEGVLLNRIGGGTFTLESVNVERFAGNCSVYNEVRFSTSKGGYATRNVTGIKSFAGDALFEDVQWVIVKSYGTRWVASRWGSWQEPCTMTAQLDDIVVDAPDNTPPEVTPTVTGSLGDNGWYTSDMTVSWTVNDPESGITASTGCDDTIIDTDTPGVTLTCTATSSGGTTSNSVTVKRDATAPTITSSRSSAPNSDGWYNTPVTVSYSASDAMSGINWAASDLGADVLSSEGAGQSASGVAQDMAGNSSSTTDSPINVDLTDPVLTCDVTPESLWPPDHTMRDVTADVAVSDVLSGPDGFVLTSVSTVGGDASADIEGFDTGVPDVEGQLRAERNGRGSGTTYTLVYSGFDVADNSASCALTVSVPHDQRR